MVYTDVWIPLPILKKGDRGAAVRTLQLLLIGNGYDCGFRLDDGVFGKHTLRALMRFQEQKNLVVSGIADAISWHMLLLSPGYEEVIL